MTPGSLPEADGTVGQQNFRLTDSSRRRNTTPIGFPHDGGAKCNCVNLLRTKHMKKTAYREILAIAAIQELIRAFNDGDRNLASTLSEIAAIVERLGLLNASDRKIA